MRPMLMMGGNRVLGIVASALLVSTCLGQEGPQPYTNDFSKAEGKSVPSDFLVLDGSFEVAEEAGNKFLELPGAPLDTFGFLFGPTLKDSATASARYFGTSQGRRSPTFTLGVCGIGGYKVRVAPAKKALELLRGDEVKTSVPLTWASGKWTHLKISVAKGASGTVVTGKAWAEGSKEPSEPTVTWTDSEPGPTGRSLVQASPYAGTPIRFDDLSASPK